MLRIMIDPENMYSRKKNRTQILLLIQITKILIGTKFPVEYEIRNIAGPTKGSRFKAKNNLKKKFL